MTRPTREELQRSQLISALRQTNGNRTEAARLLGVTRVTVWNRMKRYGIDYRP
jgi:transcriptional regulator of acetoin/glycerol metabolism